MARASIRHPLSLTVALLLACANGSLPDAPPLTGEGLAGQSATPSGAGTATGGADSSSGGTPDPTGGSGNTSAGDPASGGDASAGNAAVAGTSSEGTGGQSSKPWMPGDPVPNGYYVAGSWKGRAWAKTSGAGSTIMPSSFDDVAFGMPYCASGSLVALPDYSATATFGVNVNQDVDPSAPANTLVPTGDGVMVSVTNRGGSPLRLELRGPNGESEQRERWCAGITGSGGFIPWSSFNTACWDGSGATYEREPIVSAAVLVPGDNEDVVPYDACLNSIGEGTGDASAGGAAG